MHCTCYWCTAFNGSVSETMSFIEAVLVGLNVNIGFPMEQSVKIGNVAIRYVPESASAVTTRQKNVYRTVKSNDCCAEILIWHCLLHVDKIRTTWNSFFTSAISSAFHREKKNVYAQHVWSQSAYISSVRWSQCSCKAIQHVMPTTANGPFSSERLPV